jgi:quercetin dioxygenase-like cupin family protein
VRSCTLQNKFTNRETAFPDAGIFQFDVLPPSDAAIETKLYAPASALAKADAVMHNWVRIPMQRMYKEERQLMRAQDAIATPAVNFRGDGAVRFLGVPTQVRASGETTKGAFGLIEHWEMPSGFASPYHTHHREDESFYILQGEVAFVLDGNWQRVGQGAFLFGPREVAHGFKAVGDKPVQMLIQTTPGGFEQFVLELAQPLEDPIAPPDFAKLTETAARYGIDIHGPLPNEPS